MNSEIQKINKIGQSIWLDSISRGIINNGELSSMISKGISGITSNPAIFQKALSSEDTYDKDILSLINSGENDAKNIFHNLSIKDIHDACELLKPVYEKTKGSDGFVSVEIDPKYANDSQSSINEGIYLNKSIDQPNVMIKVPGTEAGMPVIEHLISLGINVNVTLLFSRSMYMKAAKAYINGLNKLPTEKISKVNSVASFFISSIDTSADKVVNKKGMNAMSISDITGIPRPTVIRKLKILLKQKDIYKDNDNLYYITKGKLITELNKLRLNNIKSLSSIISRINNIIFFS